MKVKNLRLINALCLFILLGSYQIAFSSPLFQVGTFNSALSGAVDGNVTYYQLKQKGDFGLGTFNGIKGEMIGLNGNFYQIGQNGKTFPVDLSWKTPYAEVVKFSPTVTSDLSNVTNYESLKSILNKKFDNKNIIYAIRVDGQFRKIVLRSRSPRSALEVQRKKEDVYTAENISGTILGFWIPEYLSSLSVPGSHFHFITDDRKLSGHVLDVEIKNAKVKLQPIYDVELQLPHTAVYKKANIKAPTLETYQRVQT